MRAICKYVCGSANKGQKVTCNDNPGSCPRKQALTEPVEAIVTARKETDEREGHLDRVPSKSGLGQGRVCNEETGSKGVHSDLEHQVTPRVKTKGLQGEILKVDVAPSFYLPQFFGRFLCCISQSLAPSHNLCRACR